MSFSIDQFLDDENTFSIDDFLDEPESSLPPELETELAPAQATFGKEASKGIATGFMQANKAVGDTLRFAGRVMQQPAGGTVQEFNLVTGEMGAPEVVPERESSLKTPGEFVEWLGEEPSRYWGEKMEGVKPRVQNFTDIDWSKPADAADWLGGAVGQMAGQMATVAPLMLAGGPEAVGAKTGFDILKGVVTRSPGITKEAGKWLGQWMKLKPMDIPIGIMEAGQVAEGQMKLQDEKGEDLHPVRALAATFLATKLEELGVENMLNRMAHGIGWKSGKLLARIGKASLGTGASEGAEEFFQTYAEQFGVDPKELGTKKTFMEAVNGAAAGFAGGMFMGGFGGVPSRRGESPAPPEVAPPASATLGTEPPGAIPPVEPGQTTLEDEDVPVFSDMPEETFGPPPVKKTADQIIQEQIQKDRETLVKKNLEAFDILIQDPNASDEDILEMKKAIAFSDPSHEDDLNKKIIDRKANQPLWSGTLTVPFERPEIDLTEAMNVARSQPAVPPLTPEQQEKLDAARQNYADTERTLKEQGYKLYAGTVKSEKMERNLLSMGYKPYLLRDGNLALSTLGIWAKEGKKPVPAVETAPPVTVEPPPSEIAEPGATSGDKEPWQMTKKEWFEYIDRGQLEDESGDLINPLTGKTFRETAKPATILPATPHRTL